MALRYIHTQVCATFRRETSKMHPRVYRVSDSELKDMYEYL